MKKKNIFKNIKHQNILPRFYFCSMYSVSIKFNSFISMNLIWFGGKKEKDLWTVVVVKSGKNWVHFVFEKLMFISLAILKNNAWRLFYRRRFVWWVFFWFVWKKMFCILYISFALTVGIIIFMARAEINWTKILFYVLK